MKQLPLLLIITPLGLAFLLPLSDLISPRWRKEILLAFVLAQGYMTVLLLSQWSYLPVEYLVGGWQAGVGISLYIDRLSAVLIALMTLLVSMTIIYSFNRISHNQGKYYVLLALMTAGLIGAISTGDLFNFYVFNEIVAITSYALVAFERRVSALEAAFKYLLYGSLSGVFFLLAVSLIYFGTGSLNMRIISERLPEMPFALLTTVTGFLLIAFSVKMGLFPFHTWLADAHAAAPSPVSALLSGAVIKVGCYGLIRVFYFIYDIEFARSLWVGELLLLMGVLSVLVGHCLATLQTESKRLLAYSSIANMGYIAMALGIGKPVAVVMGVVHMLAHGMTKAGLFLAVGSLTHEAGSREIAALQGALYRWRYIALLFGGLVLGILGIPPLVGFISKWTMIQGFVRAEERLALGVFAFGTTLSLYYYFCFALTVYRPLDCPLEMTPEFTAEGQLNVAAHLPVVLLLVATFVTGLLPGMFAWDLDLLVRLLTE